MSNTEAPKKPPRPDDAVVAVEIEMYSPDMLARLDAYREAREARKDELRAKGELPDGTLTSVQIHELMVECGLIAKESDQATGSTSEVAGDS